MKLVLGTAQFGADYGIANKYGRMSLYEARRLLLDAGAHGMNMLDTAIAYGESETMLGQIGVSEFHIITKMPAVPDDCSKADVWIENQIKGSLGRLGIDCLYALLLHRPDQLFGAQAKKILSALEDLKAKGMIKKIGISIYSPDELEQLYKVLHFDLVQAPLNILDHSMVDSGWIQRLKRMGVELHVRSVFLQGLLLMPSFRRPDKFNRWQAVWSEWDRWLTETGLSPLEACLRYVLSIDTVERIVIGVDNVEQLKEVLAVEKKTLTTFPNWPQNIDTDLINPSHWSHL
jgi:aryl-alcohol dehydrogenase-like predicted oxidoreductase